jgi:hypothetical protein
MKKIIYYFFFNFFVFTIAPAFYEKSIENYPRFIAKNCFIALFTAIILALMNGPMMQMLKKMSNKQHS